ncbi:MAG TPA: hypothetical protein VHT96_01745 [Clostridia bacterium]|nr:hypothetical protein [Clostridia bacterium]
MKLFKTVYLTIGIVLSAFVLILGMAGLPSEDRELYGAAVELDKRASNDIWPGLNINDYPVAVRKGSSEYVITKNEIQKRKPALPVTACTAYPVNGEMNVFLPSKAELDSIGQIAEGMSSDPQYFFINRFSIESRKLSDTQYIAFLHHEALHAYQYEYFEKQLRGMEPACEESEIELLLEEADKDPVISSIDAKMTALLYMLSTDGAREGITEYLSARAALMDAYAAKLGQEKTDLIRRYVERTETVEGTARYVEFKTAEALNDKKLMQQYLTGLKEKAKGREKYYRSGMTLCLLLDRYDPGWKQQVFAGPASPAALLEKSAKGF